MKRHGIEAPKDDEEKDKSVEKKEEAEKVEII
jgi:hypothetical protein